MVLVIFMIGFVVGVSFTMIFRKKDKIYGVIEVDHDSEMVKFHISSTELGDYKTKKATFKVSHDATISREKQGL